MTPEEKNPKAHHQTVRGARLSLARKEISQDSYRSVLAGRLSLAEARNLGRDGGPSTPPPEKVQGTSPEPSPCLCGCGQRPRSSRSRFVQGHDHRLYGELKRNLKNDPLLRSDKFTDEQKAYAVERGLVGPEVLPEESDG
jgi:hypothetical protein